MPTIADVTHRIETNAIGADETAIELAFCWEDYPELRTDIGAMMEAHGMTRLGNVGDLVPFTAVLHGDPTGLLWPVTEDIPADDARIVVPGWSWNGRPLVRADVVAV